MIARVGLASVLVLAGCGDGPSLRVRLDIDASDCPEQPALITLPCSGEVGVWLLDDNDRVLEESCIPLERGQPLFGLDDILRSNQVSFNGRAPGERVVIEVGVFADSFDGCPRGSGAVDPLVSSFVFGRSEPIEVADGAEANVTLSCVLVDDFQCDPAFTITANLIELQLLTTVELTLRPDETFFAGAVNNNQGFEVASVLVSEGDVWSGLAAEPPQGDCFGTELVVDDTSLDPLLSCSGDIDIINNEGTIEAHYLSPTLRTTLDELVNDEGPPPVDLVVGRVLDADGTPAGNATVAANGTVQYPNEQFTALGSTDTASHGFFIISGPQATCCDDVIATGDPNVGAPRTGRVETGTVPGHMVTTLIRLEP